MPLPVRLYFITSGFFSRLHQGEFFDERIDERKIRINEYEIAETRSFSLSDVITKIFAHVAA